MKRRRRAEEHVRHILKEADLLRDFRVEVEALCLACLACDAERRQEAESFCQELVGRSRLHLPAIIWALGRGFQVDLSKSRKALESLFDEGRADLNQTIALAACHIRDGRAQRAEKILQRARERFEKEGRLDLWQGIHAQLPPDVSPEGRALGDRETELGAGGTSTALLAGVLQDRQEENWQAVSDWAKEAWARGQITAFTEACETLAQQGQWELLLPYADVLLSRVGTADAARMAALAMFHEGQYEECLDLLATIEDRFPGGRLSSDLHKVKIEVYRALGRLPEAIALARERALQETTTLEDHLGLIDLYSMKGDLTGAAFHARGLNRQTNVPPLPLLRTAARIAPEDPDLGRDLFRKAVEAGIPDQVLAQAVYVGERLGAADEVQPLMARLPEVASSEEGASVRTLTDAQLRNLLDQLAEEATNLEDAYARGAIHIHYIVERLNLSLAELLSPLRVTEDEIPAERNHPLIFFRHGGRGVPTATDLPADAQGWRLHLDTTALLIADALDILPAVERLFRPLWIPQHLPLALARIEEMEAIPRPSRVQQQPQVDRERRDRIEWLKRLRRHLSNGIDHGTYRPLPESPVVRSWQESSERASVPEHLALVELFGVDPAPETFLWVDDRWVNSRLHLSGATIVSCTDLLVALEAYGAITRENRFQKLQRLREANFRYIPLSHEELLHSLRGATVLEGEIMETRYLRTLRRYFANCFLAADLLQRPPVPEFIRNPHGETWFFLSFNRTVQEGLSELFQDVSSTREERWARAEWLWNSLRIPDMPGLLHTGRSEDDRLTWLGHEVGGLLARAVLLAWKEPPQSDGAGREFLDWIERRVLRPPLRANPGLLDKIALFFKESLLFYGSRTAPDEIPEDILRAIQGQFISIVPDLIRFRLLADEEVGAALGDAVQATVGFGGVTFSSRTLWAAVEDAVSGEETEICTVEGDRRFRVQRNNHDENGQSIYLEERPQGASLRIIDLPMGLFSGDIDERRIALRAEFSWFDLSESERSAQIERIAALPEAGPRLDTVLDFRRASAAHYYRKLADVVRKETIEADELLPPSAESLLRYHRLDREQASVDFPVALEQGARQLIADEGLEEAIRRFAGLPVPWPPCLQKALGELAPEESHQVLRRSLGGSGSPLTAVQLVRCRLELAGEVPTANEQLLSLVDPLFDETLQAWAEAFVTALRWVELRFNLWEEMLGLPAPIRLALVWSHAHRVVQAFSEAGAEPESVRAAFSRPDPEAAWRPEILVPDLTYEDDCAHPARVEPESLLFHGLLYALESHLWDLLETLPETWWHNLATREEDGVRVPRPPFLQDHGLARNALASFLRWDRWQGLADPGPGPKPWLPPPGAYLRDRANRAIDELRTDINNPDLWLLLSVIVGTLSPAQEAADSLATRLTELDFTQLHGRDPDAAFGAAFGILRWAAQVAPRIESTAASSSIRDQILIASTILRSRQPTAGDRQADPGTLRDWAGFLLDACRWASLTPGQPEASVECFGTLVHRVVEAWPELLPTVRQVVQRLCRVLPLEQAVLLRPLLLHLRASGELS